MHKPTPFMAKKVFTYCAVSTLALLFGSSAAIAAPNTLGEMAGNVLGHLSAIEKLLMTVSVFCGLGFTLGALFQFKAHKESPTQTPLSKPIVLLVIGATLAAMPAFMTKSGETMGLKTKGSPTGGGLENVFKR